MATITEIRQINQAIAALTINKLISDRHDLHTDIKIELYRSGMAYRAIADLFTANGIKTTHQTVAKVVTRAGISRAHAVRKIRLLLIARYWERNLKLLLCGNKA